MVHRTETPNVDLSKMTADWVEDSLATIARREGIAYTTARSALITFRAFLRWLSSSKTYPWTLPVGYTFNRVEISKTTADRARTRKHFTLAEINILWRHADEWDRAIILLALNCGFSRRELATLQSSEIVPNGSGTYIKRTRWKTGIYAEWRLWPTTIAALETLRRYRGKDTTNVVHARWEVAQPPDQGRQRGPDHPQ